jgi:hypothetical protein
MPTTKHVVIGSLLITLYSLDGKVWFSSPISLLKTKQRLQREGEELRKFWKNDRNTLGREEFSPVPEDPAICGGMVKL